LSEQIVDEKITMEQHIEPSRLLIKIFFFGQEKEFHEEWHIDEQVTEFNDGQIDEQIIGQSS